MRSSNLNLVANENDDSISRAEQTFLKALQAPRGRMLYIHPPYVNGPVYVIATPSAAIHHRLGGFTPAEQLATARYFNSKSNTSFPVEFTPAGATSPCQWMVTRSVDSSGKITFLVERR